MNEPWHYTTPLDLLDHWQALVTGLLALGAGIITVRATIWAAKQQVQALRETAQQEIAATREAATLQIEGVTAAARLQIDAALAQTNAARQQLQEQRNAAAKMVYAVMNTLRAQVGERLASYKRHPSNSRFSPGGPVLVLDLKPLHDLKPSLLLLDAELGVRFVEIEAKLGEFGRASQEHTAGIMADRLEVLMSHIADLKRLAEESVRDE